MVSGTHLEDKANYPQKIAKLCERLMHICYITMKIVTHQGKVSMLRNTQEKNWHWSNEKLRWKEGYILLIFLHWVSVSQFGNWIYFPLKTHYCNTIKWLQSMEKKPQTNKKQTPKPKQKLKISSEIVVKTCFHNLKTLDLHFRILHILLEWLVFDIPELRKLIILNHDISGTSDFFFLIKSIFPKNVFNLFHSKSLDLGDSVS